MKPINISGILRRRLLVWLFISLTIIICAGVVFVKFFGKSKRAQAAEVICDNAAIRNCTVKYQPTSTWSGPEEFILRHSSIIENSNMTLSDPRVVVIFSGEYKFNSLTIDGVTVTHDPLIAPAITDAGVTQDNDFDFSSSHLTSAGEAKKVDIEVAGNLSFLNGGKIDVSGKGYPGSDDRVNISSTMLDDCHNTTEGCGKGYGPGGGRSTYTWDELTRGGGAGHAGAGGDGLGSNNSYGISLRGAAYDVNVYELMPHGSGGGAAFRTHNGGTPKRGAAGGGYINIVASDILTDGNSATGLFANGLNPTDTCLSWASCGGAGSGGMINVLLKNHSGQTSFSSDVRAGRSDAAGRSGEVGLSTTDAFVGSSSIIVEARGGDGGPDSANEYSAASGAGGIIKIVQKKNNTIKKWLEPIKRAGNLVDITRPETIFDPYALKIGDEIKVNLKVSRFNNETVIEDNFLSNSAGRVCRPFSFDGKGSVPADKNNVVRWTQIVGPDLYYLCRVE